MLEINLYVIILLLFIHYVADFVFQTNQIARNKSKSNIVLFEHVHIYSLILLIPAFILFDSLLLIVGYSILNGLLHFMVDYFTSRKSSELHALGKLGSDTIPNFGFFSVIGFDQFLHYVCLFSTYILFINIG